jgi:hypothetical protein
VNKNSSRVRSQNMELKHREKSEEPSLVETLMEK